MYFSFTSEMAKPCSESFQFSSNLNETPTYQTIPSPALTRSKSVKDCQQASQCGFLEDLQIQKRLTYFRQKQY